MAIILIRVVIIKDNHNHNIMETFIEVRKLMKISIGITHNMINKEEKQRSISKRKGKTFGIHLNKKQKKLEKNMHNKSRITLELRVKIDLVKVALFGIDISHKINIINKRTRDTLIQDLNMIKDKKQKKKNFLRIFIKNMNKNRVDNSDQQAKKGLQTMTAKVTLTNLKKQDFNKKRKKNTNNMSLKRIVIFII